MLIINCYARSAYSFTLSKADSRDSFKQGDTMPDCYLVTKKVTKLINGGTMALDRRKAAKKSIGSKFVKQYGACK